MLNAINNCLFGKVGKVTTNVCFIIILVPRGIFFVSSFRLEILLDNCYCEFATGRCGELNLEVLAQ